MRNLLVSIEFDENNFLLINKAKELARGLGSKVWILHIAAPDPDFVGYEVGPQYIRDTRAEELRKEHRLIGKFTEELKENGVETEGLLVQGATTEMILNECDHLNIDLLIIGRHKQGFLKQVFGESIVSSVIEKSKIPVLLVPLQS